VGLMPSDVFLTLIKADFGESVAVMASDFVRNTRLDAQYELYKDVARLKGNHNSIVSLEVFKDFVESNTVHELF
jgi:hypothetical protein